MKRIKTLCTAVSVILCFGLMFAGCAAPSQTTATGASTTVAPETSSAAPASSSAAASAGKVVNITVLMNDTKDFQAKSKAGYEKWAAENLDKAKVTILDAQGDMSKQVSQCESAINNHADVIVIVPVDSTACDSITDMCKKASVPLVCAQNPADSGYDIWVGSDHTLAGKLEAEYIAKTLNGKGNVGIIYGGLGNDATLKRWNGAKDELAKSSDIKIVVEATGNWMRDQGQALMENWLQRSDIGKNLNAVIGGNDEMAIGAALAAVAADRKDIVFAGVDATSDALKWVAGENGVNYCSVFQNAFGISGTACDYAVRIANGEKFEAKLYVDVPYELVTKDNYKDYENR